MPTKDILALQLARAPAPSVDLAQFSYKSVGGAEAAVINGSSVIAFAAGIDPAIQEDILYSFQIANRAADGVANPDDDIDKWFREYARVLQLTGWTGVSRAPQRQQTVEGEVELAKEALALIAAAIAGPAPAVLKLAIETMGKMADDSGFIKLFEHYGVRGSIGNFQLGQVDRGAGGDLAMTAGAFLMKLKETRQKFLFIKWLRKDVTIWADVQKMVFSPAQYAQVRKAVVEKLGSSANDAIADLDLG